jgi:hypothetical protein
VICYSSETGDGRDALLDALEKALAEPEETTEN